MAACLSSGFFSAASSEVASEKPSYCRRHLTLHDGLYCDCDIPLIFGINVGGYFRVFKSKDIGCKKAGRFVLFGLPYAY